MCVLFKQQAPYVQKNDSEAYRIFLEKLKF